MLLCVLPTDLTTITNQTDPDTDTAYPDPSLYR